MSEKEKRHGKRVPFNANIIFSVFNRKERFTPYFSAYYDAYHRAYMRNCSQDGMYFDSDYDLKRRSHILVKMTDGKTDLFSARNTGEICQAEVMWSARRKDCSERCFRIGVNFTDARA